jgi:hypothetical protein
LFSFSHDDVAEGFNECTLAGTGCTRNSKSKSMTGFVIYLFEQRCREMLISKTLTFNQRDRLSERNAIAAHNGLSQFIDIVLWFDGLTQVLRCIARLNF